jgi:hypothetical protein
MRNYLSYPNETAFFPLNLLNWENRLSGKIFMVPRIPSYPIVTVINLVLALRPKCVGRSHHAKSPIRRQSDSNHLQCILSDVYVGAALAKVRHLT